MVTHGGVEMGQGLHTKVAQIAASCFDIPLSSVFISETSTDKVCIYFGRIIVYSFSCLYNYSKERIASQLVGSYDESLLVK